MKRILFLSLFFTFSVANFFAKEIPIEKDLYEYNNIVATITKPASPVVSENYIIFTAEASPRFVGIAFDFENYQTIHPFQLRTTKDIDENIRTSVLFFLLERPAKLKNISYRLIIDGLWTTDPNNPNKIYDPTSGVSVSTVNVGMLKPEITNATETDGVKFIYQGESGQQVRLGGTFTNWDSWIYELKETKPGFYELVLPLPEGTYYYNYYLGMNSIIDKTNPKKAYTADGRTTSVIEVPSKG